jgi:hypothetical protein
MKDDKKVVAGLCIYFVMAIIVFGYSYNADYEPETNQFNRSINGFRAAFCAMFWPGYVSLKAFEGVRK